MGFSSYKLCLIMLVVQYAMHKKLLLIQNNQTLQMKGYQVQKTMKRGNSYRIEQKYQLKNEETRLNPALKTNLFTGQEKSINKKFQDQKANKINRNQVNSQAKKEIINTANNFQYGIADSKQSLNCKQQKGKKTQQQKQRYCLQQVNKKQQKQQHHQKGQQYNQEINPKTKKHKFANRQSFEVDQSLNQSCFLINKVSVSPEKENDFQKKDMSIHRVGSLQMEERIKKIDEQYQKICELINQKFSRVEQIQQKIYNEAENRMILRFERLMKEQRQYTKTQERKQVEDLFRKLQSQLQAQQNKISHQLDPLKQIIKNMVKTYQSNSSSTTSKNYQSNLQKQIIQLKAELYKKEIIQSSNIKKIKQIQNQLKENYEGKIRQINNQYQEKIKQLQLQLQQQLRQKEQQKPKPKVLNQQPDIIIASNLLNYSSLLQAKSFIKKQIESFQNKTVDFIQLIFQKDHKNNNFGVYMDGPMFPFILLIQTQKEQVFGAYSRGFQTYKNRWSPELLQQKQKIKAFLFNINRKQTFINDRKTSVGAVQYMDSLLRFGNSEIVIKNNNLEMVKVNANNIIGECYYTIKNRRFLSGEEEDQVKIKRFQLHRVYFKPQ